MLAVEDLAGQDEASVREHIVSVFEIDERELDGFKILIAYESVGSWGCDSSNWFLLSRGVQLYENHAGHCSCNGFEEQWSPEETSIDYLLSEKFYLSCGGYDSDSDGNKDAVGREICRLFAGRPETISRKAAITAQKARVKNPYIEA